MTTSYMAVISHDLSAAAIMVLCAAVLYQAAYAVNHARTAESEECLRIRELQYACRCYIKLIKR